MKDVFFGSGPRIDSRYFMNEAWGGTRMRIARFSSVDLSAVGLMTLTAALFAPAAGAVPFEFVRIGDEDGFGYVLPRVGGGTYTAANGGAADSNGNNVLEVGEFLPDLNTDRVVATGSGDDFDNRSNEGTVCTGCVVGADTAGIEFTDIALSTSYDDSQAASSVLNANTGTEGTGGAFPAGSSATLPNQPGFVFDFFVASNDIEPGDEIFLNVVFGDYDVAPAEVVVTNGSTSRIELRVQGSGDDGLIQAATALLDFDTVFTPTAGGFDGFLKVDFEASEEPYTAFDFVELSLVTIVPEPSTALLLASGLAGLAAGRRRSSSGRQPGFGEEAQ